MKGLSIMAVSVLLLAVITIPAPSSQRHIPMQIKNRCVRHRRLYAGVVEVVCNPVSFQCLSSIPTYGFPKCKPVYKTIESASSLYGNNTTFATQKQRRVTVDCVCAGK
ncbi:hypothetical protein OS493_001378 [Desmophyllum pertusum]|uniref:Uncharacterized protein n=1 Tax=Desmophyllum pertusum TaxID=174260 RepID=A0A9W9ZGW6_9CNID|nr:hypothetical protein OS493_001378 [Desmophyllum pertusum]